MTILKFECPGCGQNLECDRSLGGDVIHCPRCCAELRIPFSEGAEIPGTIKRAELILHAPAPAPGPSANKHLQPAPPTPQPTEMVCPVCQSQLRAPAAAPKPGAIPPVAELVRKGEPRQEPPTPAANQEAEHPDLDHMPLAERERRIAAAREAHPIQLNPPIKPRLSYVLSGEPPVPGKETSDKHESPQSPKESKAPEPPNTFTE